MQIPKVALVIALCISWTGASIIQSIARPILKSVKERAAKYARPDLALMKKPITKKELARCLGDWDSGTHMTTGEWRRACERSVKLYPATFR
jgi:hypothetical protein